MELLQLRYFILAARLENITKAAGILHIPQPALSSTIKRLEGELGRPLFDRRGNRLSLNEAGRRYLQKVESALCLLDEANQEIAQYDSRTLSGTVALQILTNRRFVTECVGRFYQRHPDVLFRIAHQPVDDPFDLYIMDAGTVCAPLLAEPLIEETLMLAVRRDHPLAGRESVALEELGGETFITMPRDHSLTRLTAQSCLEAGFYPCVAITCDDPQYIRKYVADGLGVALVPSFSWQGLFDEHIALIALRTPILRRSVVAWNPRRCQSKAAAVFRSYLTESIQAIRR